MPRAFREASALCDHRGDGSSPWRRLVAGARNAFVPAALRRLERRLRGRFTSIDTAIVESVINPDFARRVDLSGRLERLRGLRWFSASGDARRDQGDTLLHPYSTVGLERYDRVASRWGVDSRHPLLDIRLVELCLSLPWHLKNRDGWAKYILRRATAEELPEQVCSRVDGMSVMWNFTSAIVACDRTFLGAIIEQRAGKLGTYVDLIAVRAAFERLEECPSWQDELSLCDAFALALWLERAEI